MNLLCISVMPYFIAKGDTDLKTLMDTVQDIRGQ